MTDENNAIVPPEAGTALAAGGRAVAPHRMSAERIFQTEEQENGAFNAAELLRVLVKWKWLIFGLTLVSVVAAVLITLAMTPVYRASVTIEINSTPVNATGSQAEVQPQQGDNEQFLRTQYGLLKSRALGERVARTLNLAEQPGFVGGSTPEARRNAAAGKVVSNIEIIPQPGSSLVEIGYFDSNPARAAQIANAVATGFVTSNLERRYNSTAYARRFLQTRIVAIRARLEETERQLVQYARAQGIVELGGATAGGGSGSSGDSLSAQSLTALNASLAQATADRIAVEQRYREAATSGVTAQVMSSPTVQGLRQQRVQLQSEYDQKLATFKPGLPEMISLQTRIASIDRAIAAESRSVTGSLQSALDEARGREAQLGARVASLRGTVLDLRNRGIQYNILQRDADTNRTLYDALLQRYKEIGVAGGVGESQASVVDSALAPGSPYSPRPWLNVAIGLIGGLVLGCAIAFGIEFVDDTIKTPEDVLNKLKMPLLGLIPKMGKNMSFADEIANPRSEIAESYHSVATALQFSSPAGMPRLILVSSSRAAEGKTSTSLALARNLARSSASVLLIDADLRKPSFKVDASNGRGLTALLRTSEPLMDHVVGTYVNNLSLLPGGMIPPNPAELLSTGRIAAILQEARESFDFVVVDAPPVLGLADAPLLASLAEVTVMVAEAGVNRRPLLNSLRRLNEVNANLAGIVLTKFNAKQSGYGYGYGYGYGEQYGADAGSRPQIDMAA